MLLMIRGRAASSVLSLSRTVEIAKPGAGVTFCSDYVLCSRLGNPAIIELSTEFNRSTEYIPYGLK